MPRGTSQLGWAIIGLLVLTAQSCDSSVPPEVHIDPHVTKLVDDLLDLDAPAPDWRQHVGWKQPYPGDGVPPDDAPDSQLKRYWLYGHAFIQPSPTVGRRFVKIINDDPLWLIEVLEDSYDEYEFRDHVNYFAIPPGFAKRLYGGTLRVSGPNGPGDACSRSTTSIVAGWHASRGGTQGCAVGGSLLPAIG